MVPTGTINAPSRFEPLATDIWQDARGHRIKLIRDADGHVIRLADGTGAHTHERLQGLADPIWMLAAFGVALFFSITTLTGLVWRDGLAGGSRSSTLAAGIAVAGSAAVLFLLNSGISIAIAASQLGSEFLFDQPQPTLQVFLVSCNGLAIIAAVLLTSLLIVWRARLGRIEALASQRFCIVVGLACGRHGTVGARVRRAVMTTGAVTNRADHGRY